MSTIAGNGYLGYDANEKIAQYSQFVNPYSSLVDWDENGNERRVFVADTYNNCVRVINCTVNPPTIETLTGKCGDSNYIDSNLKDSRFRWPVYLRFLKGSNSRIYIEDYYATWMYTYRMIDIEKGLLFF